MPFIITTYGAQTVAPVPAVTTPSDVERNRPPPPKLRRGDRFPAPSRTRRGSATPPYNATPQSHVTAGAEAAGHPATARPLLRVRIHAENPNHHLWNNHGTWFLHYTVHPTPCTKERVRRSLGTSSLDAARERRDAFFAHQQAQAVGSPNRVEAAA